MIKGANFTYSPLGKALEKQAKSIESQDEKQVKAIKEHGKQLVRSNELPEYSLPIDKRKEIFQNLDERKTEIEELYNSINFKNLVYNFKGGNADINFSDFIGVETLYNTVNSHKKMI